MKVLVLCGATDLPFGLKATKVHQGKTNSYIILVIFILIAVHAELINALIEQGHEVHAVSQRGHIASDRARGHHFMTIEEYEKLVQELLQNKIADVIVIPNDLLFVESKIQILSQV